MRKEKEKYNKRILKKLIKFTPFSRFLFLVHDLMSEGERIM